jgi:putative ATP-dependent endonuclease of OLD family
MNNRSKLLRLWVRNIGCIGDEGIGIDLDDIVCLVGRNNAGKSTILKAYELAQGSLKFDYTRDRCTWAPGDAPSAVVLDIHIPAGVANIAEDWKIIDGDNLILRSCWEWSPNTGFEKVRTTWSPEAGDWALDGKAGGADNVFKARLPEPLRIGSLEDANSTEATLLALALGPFIQEVVGQQEDPSSPLAQTVASMINLVAGLSETHQQRFSAIAEKVQGSFAGVFPGVSLKLNIAMNPPSIKVGDLLKAGSGLKINDGKSETSVVQQGTGARRALFWSMLRVHNELKRTADQRDKYRKNLLAQINAKKITPEDKADLEAKLAAFDDDAPIPLDDNDPALPGYLLLIDEPENALHPMAARAAQRHLYELAADPDWQVMMTTHSPYFINPLADHTTVVRMERNAGDITFDADEKRNLQALQQMDASFSEVFFGSYPILVEGDTEHAAFIASVIEEEHDLADKVTIVRARGKAILPALIRMLRHFKIGFGVLHDVDWPFNKAGKAAMWTVNASIHAAVAECRTEGLIVRHRVSVPDFERFLGGAALGKDKPFAAYEQIAKSAALKDQVRALVSHLHTGTDFGPWCDKPHEKDNYLEHLKADLVAWAAKNGASDDPRLTGNYVD